MECLFFDPHKYDYGMEAMQISNLKNMKCFITGAASGIGKAVAIAAAAEGAELFLTDINDIQLNEVVTHIKENGGKVSLFKAIDISSYEEVKAFTQEIYFKFGSMNIIMNIAGISIWGSIENLDHRDWRRSIDVNLMGPIHVMGCMIPVMIEAEKGGHLVNVSSAACLFGLPWHAAYSASKFGLRGISEVLLFDLKQHGIGVSLVCPGAVNTGLVSTVEIKGVDRNNRDIIALKEHFQKRAVTPEKAAQAILKGIKRNQYMVFTSADIQIGYWFQRKISLPYRFVMQLLNNRINTVANASLTTNIEENI